MKIDKTRLKKSTSEVPSECQVLIDRLKSCTKEELQHELADVETWTFGKCELFHWIDILDKFDNILEEACTSQPNNKFSLACDTVFTNDDKSLLLLVLHFTTLLIEHSFSRHLYNSMEHLVQLLSSSNMDVVIAVLNLLYMFSKRSNFITRLNSEKRQALLYRLNYLAESWGGKEYGFGLADCCKKGKQIPKSASTLYYEYFAPDGNWALIHIKDIHSANSPTGPAQYMKDINEKREGLSEEKKMHIFTRLRLAASFLNYQARLQFVQARLQALSVLVYSNALQENAHTLLYPGFLEELVELLELTDNHLVEIRAAALRTLTSIIHLDRNPHFPKKPGSRLNMIIDVTGAGSYHGFLPVLVRTCIGALTQTIHDETNKMFPLPLATALFSFLYHLASYESGGEALVSCGMMESLLKVINWPGHELEHITFVTRAVRVIDLITNIDMQAFHTHGGLNSFVSRLHMEVNVCRREQRFEIVLNLDDVFDETVDSEPIAGPSTSADIPQVNPTNLDNKSSKTGRTCLPQRAALLKSMLNFLKKAIQDPAFSDSIRHVMEGTLPASLKHIISNAEYYGPSLFLLATDVVTVYVFQEPSHLSSLQDNGLTDVVLHALLIKDVPATREVLGSLPNVFSALCLNTRGLLSFVKCKPFDRLFKVLLSPVYLSAMRRRRNSHPMSDTASNLGNAMDELMRHQPSLKVDATAAIIKLLEELVQLGTDPKYICWRAQGKESLCLSLAPTTRPSSNNEAGSSDEEDEDEEEASTSSQTQRDENQQDGGNSQTPNEKTPIALVDYILNVMKFVDAILSNNSTDDHCREFVSQGGLVPLLSILGLPNLPVDCPVTAAAQSVASVCKSVLNLGHEPQVLQLGLEQLHDVVLTLEPLYNHLKKTPGGSVLLTELANAPNLETAFQTASATPLLHAMGAAHGYIVMFVHVCRSSQSEIRALALQKWGQDSEFGKALLFSLVRLYTALVWESTLLLALCSDDIIPPGCDFGKADLEKLIPPEAKTDSDGPWSTMVGQDSGSNGMTSAMEALSTNPSPTNMDVDLIPSISGEKSKGTTANSQQLKYIKPLLGASSRLGRALAELFGLLVKLCVGSPLRQRRGQNIPSTPNFTNPASRDIARVLSYILVEGMTWEMLPHSPIPKFRLTFLICSVGFTSPMLFDEKRYAYHLMLHVFVEEGGQSAFFSTFRWALTAGRTIPLCEALEHPDLPDGTGEFLDAWLLLLEKMVNPKSILDSPHIIPISARKIHYDFEPVRYLTEIHTLAFHAIMMMWGKKPLKTYGSRMSETMLSILRHILRGEQIIRERAYPQKEPGATTSTDRAASATVNQEELKQLLDMGFSKEHSVEALTHTTNVVQATDYLCNNPSPQVRMSYNTTELDTDDEDQLRRAIALSLGDSNSKKASSGGAGSSKAPVAGPSWESSDCKKKRGVFNLNDSDLKSNAMDYFTNGALNTCLNLLDTLPDCVYRVCVLLVTITKRNGSVWREVMLDALVKEIAENVEYLLKETDNEKPASENLNVIFNSEQAHKAAVRIYLFTLLFEGAKIVDMRIPNTQVVRCEPLIPKLLKLLIKGEQIMRFSKTEVPGMPKWMPPLLLMLNLVEKVASIAKRQDKMEELTSPIWKCYDMATGKWTPYSASNNKLMNEAYWRGDDEVRIVIGRQRYVISFIDFRHTDFETNCSRMIIRTPKCLARENVHRQDSKTKDLLDKGDQKEDMEVEEEEEPKDERRRRPKRELRLGLSLSDQVLVIQTCVRLMKLPVDRDTLHALMRICLRYTRQHNNAVVFAKEGGVRLLLETTQGSSYTGFVNLATMLIRHVIEEPRTLWLAMEGVVRLRTNTNIPPIYRELFYYSSQISSAIARHPDIYQSLAQNTLRVDINVLNRRNPLIEDNRLMLKSAPPQVDPKGFVMEDIFAIRVIYDLLNALVKPVPDKPPAPTPTPATSSTTTTSAEKPSTSAATTLGLSVVGNVGQIPRITASRRSTHTIDMFSRNATAEATNPPDNGTGDGDDNPGSPLIPLRTYSRESKKNAAKTDEEYKRPLLPKSQILKILAEAVRSYQTVPLLITEYVYRKQQSDMVKENTKALAFILDKLLPVNENSMDRECSTMARLLIASLASATDVVAAQVSVVYEVKQALLRALAMPEGVEKHNQLQLLTGLIPTMIENCPTENSAMLKVLNYPRRNGIFSIMLRKGLISDLARVPQYLDLSSPNTVATINATLKPLETLLRISNQSAHGAVQKFAKTKSRRSADHVHHGATSESHAQGDDISVDDSENTDHDISGTLEPTPEVHMHNTTDEHPGLEDIMDHLLERDMARSNPYRQVAVSEQRLDDQRNMEAIAYNPDRDATEDMMSSDSGDSNDDSNGSEQDDREMDEDGEENDEEAELESDPFDYDDPFEFYDDEVVQSLFRMRPIERDNEDILMIQYPDPDNEAETENSRRGMVHWTSNGLSFPFGVLDDTAANGNDNSVPTSHPLLMARHNLDPTAVSGTRAQRTNRQRRYHYLQINPRIPNPPVILQRLLGPSQNRPQILSGTGFRGDSTRVLVMDNGFGIFTNNHEEEQIDFVDQSGYLFGPSLSATLGSTPVALNWWNQEAAVLDGDSRHCLVMVVCSNLIGELERHKAVELAKTRGKRKKKTQDDDEGKSKSQDKDFPAETSVPMETEAPASRVQATNTELSYRPGSSVPSLVHSRRRELVELTTGFLSSLSDILPSVANTTDGNHSGDETPLNNTESQSSSTPSGSPLAHWAMESQNDEESNAQRSNNALLTETISEDTSELPTPQTSARNTRSGSNCIVLLENQFSLSPSHNHESPRTSQSVPCLVSSPPQTLSPEPVVEADNTSQSSNAQDSSNDLIVGITGSPSRQPLSQSSVISISSDSWPGAQESQPSSSSTARTDSAPSASASASASTSSATANEIPEGVDPSFLAALPDEMRAEVIAEQLRLQRIRQRAQNMSDASPIGPSEVNPEFLAALPPSIQEEVLAQQRMEQQRQAAAAANPNDPVDAAAFFQNLQPSLRQAILTDMEESQISVLPPDLAAEAQNLRRDWESRNRQMMQERFLHQMGHPSNALSSILRSSRGIRAAQFGSVQQQRPALWTWQRPDATGSPSTSLTITTNMERTGRPLLDQESLTCLLVLLFVDEPKFNTLRLHRVIRNLCYHVPTREWVIKSLLSIMDRSNETNDPFPLRSAHSVDRPQWLNISLDAALGCRANVFLMKRAITRRQKNLSPIAIHPQAAAVVCKHTLELLISLAKSFPAHFLPLTKKKENESSSSRDEKSDTHFLDRANDFWEILVRLDSMSQSRKGKCLRVPRDFIHHDIVNRSFETSPFGQLITMLAFSVIKKSSQLTDKLLRLLSLISSDLPITNPYTETTCKSSKLPLTLEDECYPESEDHLKLAIQVLISKSCSEDGLEDTTALLLNLSHFSNATRHMILRLLLDGARDLGVMVQSHINDLMKELQKMNNKNNDKDGETSNTLGKDLVGDHKKSKGILKNRFTKDKVVVAASSKTKTTCDLQLPSMAPLIAKTSSQAFFLRILKVIVQIREAVKEANKKQAQKDKNSATGVSEESAMDTSNTPEANTQSINDLPLLSESLNLDPLWNTLSQCLKELEETPDHHAVLVLQPAVEAFFLVHASSQPKRTREPAENNTTTNEESSSAGAPAGSSGQLSPTYTVDSEDIAPLSPIEGIGDRGASYGSNSGMQAAGSSTNTFTSLPYTSLVSSSSTAPLHTDQKKFLSFAETHRTVLNQILRQSTTHLADGPFSVLVDHTRILDFDVKRRYFRSELERLDEGIRREELAVHVRRPHIFEDSFRELYRRNAEEWKNRFYIVFEDEEGQDAGGLLREWYVIISRDIFNPMYALFTVSPGDRVTYMINSSSHCNPNHLCYYKFVGRVIAKAIYDNKLLECYFTRSFYKHILGIQVKHTDMESEDYSFYQGLVYLTEHNVSDLGYELTFSAEVQEFGVTEVRDLIPNGREINVTEENKNEYIRRVCQMKMCTAIQQQLNAFLEGFYDIIPKRLISIFNEQELELLISGLPNVDIEDLKANTEYHKYQTNSIQIQWFWRSLRSFDQADRAKFLQFVTGTSKVPLQGFAALEGMNGVQKFQIHRDDRSTDRLPSAHTCFNQLDLPVYETYDKLRSNLLKAIHECSEGFGFA